MVRCRDRGSSAVFLPRFGPCTVGSRWALTGQRSPPARDDRPALREVAVRTSQHPSPRRFRCVRAPGAGPGWPVPFTTSRDYCGCILSSAPATGPFSSSQTREHAPGQDVLERGPPLVPLTPCVLTRATPRLCTTPPGVATP